MHTLGASLQNRSIRERKPVWSLSPETSRELIHGAPLSILLSIKSLANIKSLKLAIPSLSLVFKSQHLCDMWPEGMEEPWPLTPDFDLRPMLLTLHHWWLRGQLSYEDHSPKWSEQVMFLSEQNYFLAAFHQVVFVIRALWNSSILSSSWDCIYFLPLPEAAVDLSSNGLVIFIKLLVHLLMAFLNHKPEQSRLGFPLLLSVAPT